METASNLKARFEALKFREQEAEEEAAAKAAMDRPKFRPKRFKVIGLLKNIGQQRQQCA